jgi:LacI family gluconate utilization system Gnt-I transcriptional repressor
MHCLSSGLSMPDDVALAGFNGLPFLEALPIRLTTVETPRLEMGVRAAQYLIDDNPPQDTPRVDLGFKLVPGETC